MGDSAKTRRSILSGNRRIQAWQVRLLASRPLQLPPIVRENRFVVAGRDLRSPNRDLLWQFRIISRCHTPRKWERPGISNTSRSLACCRSRRTGSASHSRGKCPSLMSRQQKAAVLNDREAGLAAQPNSSHLFPRFFFCSAESRRILSQSWKSLLTALLRLLSSKCGG